ncbi:MAG: molybdenum cofactor guanylyltransferase, partial [Bryobacter sp.]|nr:molybdenum cofactor guanylyltransferase [Bryobacter sp.]
MSADANHAGIRCRGWILAGGASRRMGRDKALLESNGEPLLLRLARLVETVAPPCTVVAPSGRYEHLGLPVIPDLHPGCGPLGGIETALSSTGAEWNLILACDMPGLSAEYLHSLVQAIPAAEACEALVSRAGGETEPLCAIYHRRLLPQVTAARAAQMQVGEADDGV